MKKFLLLITLAFGLSQTLIAQEDKNLIPEEYRGNSTWIARGIMDGNLIETNFRNHGEMARWNDIPWGVWPRGIGDRHIDGIAIVIGGQVKGERLKWPDLYPNARFDTTINPVIINYRDFGRLVGGDGNVWGWLPLNGFYNPNRFDPITGSRIPNPALSDDPTSWPDFWPDRLDEEQPGWPSSWNGLFGRGIRNADLEAYYVMDDYSDRAYHIDTTVSPRAPFSPFGVYYSDPQDSTKGGMGLQVKTRLLQWANVLAEDAMFLLYTITNRGGTDHENLYFTNLIDYGLGNEEGDENAAYDPILDVVYGWDQDGIGQRVGGGTYTLGYTGMAFLESPANDDNMLDDDQDGITDEGRFEGPGTLIVGQDEIRAYVQANYNLADFENFNGPLETQPAYKAGRWWTADENLDWVGFTDINGNGQHDSGEPLNDDVGADGVGPYDFSYTGPDAGEGDGIPKNGEPNYNVLDVDESDQIGLRGFDLNTRPFYENGENLRQNGDTWIFGRIQLSLFDLGTEAEQFVADVEPFALFVSGPVKLGPDETDFFSTVWLFGDDEADFFRNRKTVQSIYNTDYNFAQPPTTPRLTAVAGDGQVILSWDTLAVSSFDRFLQEFDFEGFKLYKGTDPLFSDAKTITNAEGTPVFFKPIAQWDLDNGINGTRTVLGGQAVYNLGDDSGLSFYYVDREVTNGKTYYYAIVAYDRGAIADNNDDSIDPQETAFRISVDQSGRVTGTTPNAAIVIPAPKASGYVEGGSTTSLEKVTSGIGTGRANARVVVAEDADFNAVYRVSFFDSLITYNDTYVTTAYMLENRTSGEIRISKRELSDVTPLEEGFVVELYNDKLALNTEKTGWVAGKGTSNEIYDKDPTSLDGYSTTWIANISKNEDGAAVDSYSDYALVWVNEADSVYRPPLFFGLIGAIRPSVPIFAINTITGAKIDYFIIDNDGSGDLTVGDKLILNERDPVSRLRKLRYDVVFELKNGESSVAPTVGNRIEINHFKPFKEGDYFEFALTPPKIDTVLAKQELKDIKVVPNPYVGASVYEPKSQIIGRGERRIRFANLPATCTIRIFNIRGELLQTLEHNGGLDNGSLFWNLQTRENQDLAYGIYVFHVDAPGLGEHIGKFAIIK